MTDLSNPTGRVLDIITLLASDPTEDFSLADIAQRTGMSKASALRILLTLADADLVGSAVEVAVTRTSGEAGTEAGAV